MLNVNGRQGKRYGMTSPEYGMCFGGGRGTRSERDVRMAVWTPLDAADRSQGWNAARVEEGGGGTCV